MLYATHVLLIFLMVVSRGGIFYYGVPSATLVRINHQRIGRILEQKILITFSPSSSRTTKARQHQITDLVSSNLIFPCHVTMAKMLRKESLPAMFVRMQIATSTMEISAIVPTH